MVNILSIVLKTPAEVRREIAARFKARRLATNLTQRELAARSGVTWSSLKRFEGDGLIALDSLLRLALVLECLGDFDKLAAETPSLEAAPSLDVLLAAPSARRKASGRRGRRP